MTEKAVTYTSYLRIDELLGLQTPRSDEHDELLFIVIHQVYELWFKQVRHELGRVDRLLRAGAAAPAVKTLGRIRAILKTCVSQLDILETMTPVEFGSFRARLESASGFQSAQFRALEAMLGRRVEGVAGRFPVDSAARALIDEVNSRPPLWDAVLAFLAGRGFAVAPPDALRASLLATYRQDPTAEAVLEALVDIDEGIQEWRYRHVKMVERTIGARVGTGGSTGAAYLRTTLDTSFFPELWAIRAEL